MQAETCDTVPVAENTSDFIFDEEQSGIIEICDEPIPYGLVERFQVTVLSQEKLTLSHIEFQTKTRKLIVNADSPYDAMGIINGFIQDILIPSGLVQSAQIWEVSPAGQWDQDNCDIINDPVQTNLFEGRAAPGA